MRSQNLSPKSQGSRSSESALLDAPEDTFAPRSRSIRPPLPATRPDLGGPGANPYADPYEEDDGFDYRRPRPGYKLRFRGRILQLPRSLWGRIAGACALLILAGCLAAALFAARSFFLHDSRFAVASSSSIQIAGNSHLGRAQLLSVFGGDVERNIFDIPLAARRAELEQLPWVRRATVMRLLPNRIRIAVTERTPVAFVRQGTQPGNQLGNQIGMVDASGVLLDMPFDAPGDPHYSFPVVTGISAQDPLSTRAARMKIYAAFTSDLDSAGGHISEKLSEVDLSNPEDVKALIPEGANDVLVHFGETDFLTRYQKFEAHLAEWRTQYPRLASVDMRYERQVVLEMQPGTAAPASNAAAPAAKSAAAPIKPAVKPIGKPAGKPAEKPAAKTAVKPAAKPAATAAPAASSEKWHMVVVKPHPQARTAPAKPAKPIPPPQPEHP